MNIKETILVGVVCLVCGGTVQAQTEQWQFQGYSIGADASGAAYAPMGAMPDVVRINSTYYMYYIAKYGSANAIWYASSPDMINWTVEDTIMTASLDPANRIYNLGGPGILKLANGDYRLFYRTSQDVTFPDEPLFHIRSMISSDGIHFTHEGIRVEIQPYQADSYFKSASHPAVYKDMNGDTKAIITGRDSTMDIGSPAGLYTASSADEGLTWTDFAPLYEKCHDPVVILDSAGIYHMYTSYLGTSHREAVSTDGINWPVTADSMAMKQGAILLDEGSTTYVIADLGAAVKSNGEIVLYSNYKPLGPGAWVDIAYYYFGGYTGMTETSASEEIRVYPNPATEMLVIELKESDAADFCLIMDMKGSIVSKQNLTGQKTIVDVSALPGGIYSLVVQNRNDQTTHRIVLYN
ncbi:MAG: T9SS type A sorting domain-containing protein [Bacteroidetes bacterium]|nr:T9SS type A sorting domain-containing protein [Bacteroidota bacterium]